MPKTIVDPLGHHVIIPRQILDINEQMIQSKDIFDDITKVIEKPVMLFQMQDGTIELYYLRAVGWNKTVLLGVQKKDGHFEAFNFELDPSQERLTELHLNSQRLI